MSDSHLINKKRKHLAPTHINKNTTFPCSRSPLSSPPQRSTTLFPHRTPPQNRRSSALLPSPKAQGHESVAHLTEEAHLWRRSAGSFAGRRTHGANNGNKVKKQNRTEPICFFNCFFFKNQRTRLEKFKDTQRNRTA